MDWKTDNSLKSLNWSDILQKPSDDEYDSDETICELNISLTEDAKKDLGCNRSNGIENINTKLDTKMTSSPGFPDNIVLNDQPNKKSVEHAKGTKLKEPANEELYSIVQLSSTLQSCSFVEKIPSTSQTEENMNQPQNIDISCTNKQHENKQYSTSTPEKQMRRKYPKIRPKKSLPKRKCHSTFIINSLRVEVEADNESSSETDDNEINTNKNISISDNEYGTRKEGNNGSRKTIRKKRGRKRKQIKDNSLIDDLNRFEVELKVMEDKVERWITGKDGESPSRQQAFEMLAQSQNLAKLVEMRRQKYLAQYCPKNEKLTAKLLVKRAKIVSGVIDKAIAEADRLMNLEETTTFDTTLEQDVGMVKTSQGNPPLKSILKHTSTIHSEKSIAYSSKHVSFSDKVDYRYISCSDEDSSDINYNSEKCSTNDVNCSYEEISSNEICENVDNENLNYNTNKTFNDEDFEALQNTISNEKVNGIEEENMMDVTDDCVTNINPDPNTLSDNIKTVEENTMKNYTDNDKDNAVAGNVTGSKLYEFNSDVHCSSNEEDMLNVAQLQDSSIEPVDTDENTKNDGITSPCCKNPHKNNHTKGICNSTDLFNDKQPSGNSEISLVTSQPILTDTEDSLGSETFTSESSYGFSKMENKFVGEAWNNITIMSIKEIRVRGNDEYSRVADASFCADDFRW